MEGRSCRSKKRVRKGLGEEIFEQVRVCMSHVIGCLWEAWSRKRVYHGP